MLLIRGTKRVLDRVGGLSATDADHSTTRLGDWYVNILFWKPHVALFVSEATLLPVLDAIRPSRDSARTLFFRSVRPPSSA